MINYFDEKESQVSVGTMEAFGVTIESRYSKAFEISEMLNFTHELAVLNVNNYVKSVFYDSKANICSFELDPVVIEGDPVALNIKEAADKTIGQYDLFGSVGHGAPMDNWPNT